MLSGLFTGDFTSLPQGAGGFFDLWPPVSYLGGGLLLGPTAGPLLRDGLSMAASKAPICLELLDVFLSQLDAWYSNGFQSWNIFDNRSTFTRHPLLPFDSVRVTTLFLFFLPSRSL